MDEDEAVWLAERLKNGPAWVRKHHAEAMGRSGDRRAVAPLRAALGDEQMGDVAARALAQLGEPAVAPLCAALKNRNRTVRARAAEILGQIGDHRSIGPLCEALSDTEWSVRTRVVDALRQIADPRAVPFLIEMLGHPGQDTCHRAAEALEQIGPPATLPLCEALRSENLSVRNYAAHILGKMGDARAVQPLCNALRRGQIEGAAALGEIALREPGAELLAAVPLLQQRLQAQRFFDSNDTQGTLRLALERIEAALISIRRLPIPASAPLPTAEALPVPASPPAPAVESLPVPAGADADKLDNIPNPGASVRVSATQAHKAVSGRIQNDVAFDTCRQWLRHKLSRQR